MANEGNLIPNTQRTPEELREQTRKGGIASGKARRIKSRGRQLVLDLLAGRETDPQICAALEKEGIDPRDLTREVAMHLRQIDKAIRKADTNAYNSVLKGAGITEDAIHVDNGIHIHVDTPEQAERIKNLGGD